MTVFGVYGEADALSAGDEISSTYEGRHITVFESELFHPYRTSTFVNKGDPVVINAAEGKIVGVALATATADTDLIAVDTEGIWALTVYGDTDELWLHIDDGQVHPGDPLFIDRVTAIAVAAGDGVGACALSKRRDKATMIPFGFALGHVAALGVGVIAVKVHGSHGIDLVPDMGNRAVPTGTMGWSFYGRLTNGASEGLNGYVDGTILGTNTGAVYGFGTWLCMDSEATVTGLITPLDTGIYSAASQGGPDLYYAGQHHAQLFDAPLTLHAWRLNSTQVVDAVIYSTNTASVGYVADAADNAGANKLGNVPLFNIAGVGVCYVEVFSA